MRVTKAIREYVEDEVYKKYNEVSDAFGEDYIKERDNIIEHVREIMTEASKKAEEYIESTGFEYSYGYRDSCLFNINGSIRKKDVEDEIYARKNEYRKAAKEKIKQILFDLEMGDTEKKQLKDVLDSIVVK